MRRIVRLCPVALLLLLALSCAGCSRRPGLDESVARSSLETALADWKAGKKPERLSEVDPPIIVVDDAWSKGAKLTDYKISEGRNDGQNMHYPVELTLAVAKKKSRTQKVMYLVGTEPSITVFRHDE